MDQMYLKEWDAHVKSVSQGKFVVLDRTAFYPKSGGVAWDTGTIKRESDGKEVKVIYAGKFSGKISHQVEPEGKIEKGDKVHCTLDWDRRYKLMRFHTAAHVLSGFFSKELDAKITGNNITIKKARIDFSLDDFDRDKIKEMIEKSNELIKKDLPVEVYYKNRKEALKDPNMVKLANALPPKVDKIRIVDIKGFDYQADGGCHVKSLKEVGEIIFIKADNKGKNNRRVYFGLK
ncbi:alanyl-tRNA editing protein AlaX [Candidatus Woesearchaeota archaeon]|nr:alanyl-tRNA editing protein AlaX [Candidatus Woesearchaeota archaeon]